MMAFEDNFNNFLENYFITKEEKMILNDKAIHSLFRLQYPNLVSNMLKISTRKLKQSHSSMDFNNNQVLHISSVASRMGVSLSEEETIFWAMIPFKVQAEDFRSHPKINLCKIHQSVISLILFRWKPFLWWTNIVFPLQEISGVVSVPQEGTHLSSKDRFMIYLSP